MSYLKEGRKMIVPIVERRRLGELQDPDYQKPNDFLQWMMDVAVTDNEREPAKLAHRLLLASQGAIHSTAMAATQALYDLCAHPEYHGLLREEIREHMPSDGHLTQTSLFRMQKLDSFIKESQRMSPPQLCALVLLYLLSRVANTTISSVIHALHPQAGDAFGWNLSGERHSNLHAYLCPHARS